MTPDVVVDIGNTRIKFGLCDANGISVVATLPSAEQGDVASVVQQFGLTGRVRWAVAGVHPQRQAELVAWAGARGDTVVVMEDPRSLPLEVAVELPGQVGIDRLLGAVAVNRRRPPDCPAVFVDAGSAITVNFVAVNGSFCGGSIAPGLGLMARALNTFTAKLPMVSSEALLTHRPAFPAQTTSAAILCGLHAAAVGGVRELLAGLNDPFTLFVTGGDAVILCDGLADLNPQLVANLTLEGIRIAAEVFP